MACTRLPARTNAATSLSVVSGTKGSRLAGAGRTSSAMMIELPQLAQRSGVESLLKLRGAPQLGQSSESSIEVSFHTLVQLWSRPFCSDYDRLNCRMVKLACVTTLSIVLSLF